MTARRWPSGLPMTEAEARLFDRNAALATRRRPDQREAIESLLRDHRLCDRCDLIVSIETVRGREPFDLRPLLRSALDTRAALEEATAEPDEPYYPDPFLEDAYRRGIARARVRVRAVLERSAVR